MLLLLFNTLGFHFGADFNFQVTSDELAHGLPASERFSLKLTHSYDPRSSVDCGRCGRHCVSEPEIADAGNAFEMKIREIEAGMGIGYSEMVMRRC